MKKPLILTVGSSDSSSGAGIQQDIKVADRLGFWAVSALSGITVQSFDSLIQVKKVEDSIFISQLEEAFDRFRIEGVKIGALTSIEHVKILREFLSKLNLPVVLDPVFRPSRGIEFMPRHLAENYKDLLFPLVTVVTPNRDELSMFSSGKTNDLSSAIEAGKELVDRYQCKIYLKGGHYSGIDVQEYLIDRAKIYSFRKKRLKLNYTHGTGCTFATMLLCFLIRYKNILKALSKANKLVGRYYKDLNKR